MDQIKEDDEFVVKGLPSVEPVPSVSVGKFIYEKLVANCSNNENFVDAVSGDSISYKQLLAKTCALAESLRRAGYNDKTKVGICSENCNDFFVAVIAALYIGATVVPFNHFYTEEEMIHALNIANPEVVFCSDQVYPQIFELKQKCHYIRDIIVIDEEESSKDAETISSFNKKYLPKNHPLYRFDVANVDYENHVAFILYSSGTTGLSKGVMIPDRSIMTIFTILEHPRLTQREPNMTVLGYLPFFHAYGLFLCLFNISRGSKIVVIKQFDPELFLSCIEKHKITGLALVPALAVLLAKSPLVDKYDLSSVKRLGSGAAPLSRETEVLLKKRLKIDQIGQAYGLTEAALTVTATPSDSPKHGSSGVVVPYISVKIRDPETGKSLGPNAVGEICIKGPTVMVGYYKNEEMTRNTFTSDGWLLTGDLGYYDKDGYFFISGRLKELIKYKGYQVPPAELEAILLTHPKIQDAAVIGVPNEDAGELPLAFIVTDPAKKLSEKEVEDFVAKRVAAHKRLRGGVLFVSEIPKNQSGKILRRNLHEMYRQQFKSKL